MQVTFFLLAFRFFRTRCYNVPMRLLPQRLFLILILTSLLSGCMKGVHRPGWISNIPAAKDALGPEEIFQLPGGEKTSFGHLLEDFQRARIVFVGENHDQIEHHRIQARILQELSDKGKDLAVGMEMFKRSQQPILDRWSQGLLAEEEFLREVDWENTWDMDYSLYKGILDEIKKKDGFLEQWI